MYYWDRRAAMRRRKWPVDLTIERALRNIFGPRWWNFDPYTVCPRCGNEDLDGRIGQGYKCGECGTRFVDSIPDEVFYSAVPYSLWILATHLLRRGASIRQLTILGISYKTAAKMASFLRPRLQMNTSRRRQISSAELIHFLRSPEAPRVIGSRRFQAITMSAIANIEFQSEPLVR